MKSIKTFFFNLTFFNFHRPSASPTRKYRPKIYVYPCLWRWSTVGSEQLNATPIPSHCLRLWSRLSVLLNLNMWRRPTCAHGVWNARPKSCVLRRVCLFRWQQYWLGNGHIRNAVCIWIPLEFEGFSFLPSKKERAKLPTHTFVTPLIMFLMCEDTVRTAATSFFVPNHFSILTRFLVTLEMSTRQCLNARISLPRGPFTTTLREFTFNSTWNKKNLMKTSFLIGLGSFAVWNIRNISDRHASWKLHSDRPSIMLSSFKNWTCEECGVSLAFGIK